MGATFAGFVACGAQRYKASLAGDHSEANIAESATDPSSPSFGIHSAGGWESLPINFQFSKELNADQRSGITKAMAVWEKAVGRKLFTYSGVDAQTGLTFPDLYGSLNDKVNGMYLESNWAKTGKPSSVLATTIWANMETKTDTIATSDIHFNEHDYLIADSMTVVQEAKDTRAIVDAETLALHELGHLLGLVHKDPSVDPDSIMNPSIFVGEGLSNRRLSEGDVRTIQVIYGCEGDACDIPTIMAELDKSPDLNEVPVVSTSASSTTPASATLVSVTSASNP